jgi:hypothetical protein
MRGERKECVSIFYPEATCPETHNESKRVMKNVLIHLINVLFQAIFQSEPDFYFHFSITSKGIGKREQTLSRDKQSLSADNCSNGVPWSTLSSPCL